VIRRSAQHLHEEPSTLWAFVSRFALVGTLLLAFGGLIVAFLPRLRAHDQANQKEAELKAKIAELEHKRDAMQDTLLLLHHDRNYIELKARDLLDLKEDGEVIFRFSEK
jgi:cell division protein FtsB